MSEPMQVGLRKVITLVITHYNYVLIDKMHMNINRQDVYAPNE